MRTVDITWAGGEHPFALNIALLRALQEKCDAGPAYILARLSSGQWRVDDILQPIRLGLEGGGMDKTEAAKKVRMYVEDGPLASHVLTAQAIIMAALYGVEDDPVGELEAGAETLQTRSETSDGGSANSTEPVQP